MKQCKILFAVLFGLTLLSAGFVVKNAENKLSKANLEIENLKSQVGNQAMLIEELTEDYNKLNDEKFDRWNYEINFINGNEDKMMLTYYVNESAEDAQVVNIIGDNYTVRGEAYNSDRIEIKGSGEHEYVKFIIFGDVYDFGLYSLTYMDSDIQNAERVLEKHIGDIKNIEVMVETTLPEGLPGEVIRWRDAEGNLYEEYLSYDGLGASGRIRISCLVGE